MAVCKQDVSKVGANQSSGVIVFSEAFSCQSNGTVAIFILITDILKLERPTYHMSVWEIRTCKRNTVLTNK